MARLPVGFTKRKDGLLQYRFTEDGKRRCVYGKTVKECQDKRDEMRDKIAQGLLTGQKGLTLAKYFEEWEARRARQVKASTIYTDRRRFKHIDAALGRKKLDEIERRDVYKLQADLSGKLSSKGVNDEVSLLRSIMQSAVDDRLIPYNPTAGVKALPKTEDEKKKLGQTHRFLTAAEIETFFRHAKGSVYENLFAFLLLTGTRCGEAGAITWDDIDRAAGVIHITKTITRTDDKHFTIGTPKTRDSKRDIMLTEEVRAVLEKQRAQQAALFGLRAIAGDKQVFTSMTGLLITQSGVAPTITYICEKAAKAGEAIERFTPHAFRHTFISHEVAAGVAWNVIAAQVGHSNTITLQKYYSHEDPEQLQAAFKMVSQNMGQIVKIS